MTRRTLLFCISLLGLGCAQKSAPAPMTEPAAQLTPSPSSGGGQAGLTLTPEMKQEWERREQTEDTDGDGLVNSEDNCSQVPNLDQQDRDGDTYGDACDACPDRPSANTYGCPGDVSPPAPMTRDAWREHFAGTDWDGDGVTLPEDNCPTDANPDQADADGDGWGDFCDQCRDRASPKGDSGCTHKEVWGAQVLIDADPVGFCAQTCAAIANGSSLAQVYPIEMRAPLQMRCESMCQTDEAARDQLISAGRSAELYSESYRVSSELTAVLRLQEHAACEQEYCEMISRHCPTAVPFPSREICISTCQSWSLGSDGDTSGDSIFCRAHYAAQGRMRDQADTCAQAAVSGGEQCVGPLPSP